MTDLIRSATLSVVLSLAFIWACGTGADVDRSQEQGNRAGADEDTFVERAQAFRSLVRQGEYDVARAMMSPDARRWFAPREGKGEPWTIGDTAGGPWARWDDHFGSQAEVVEWTEDERSATAILRERTTTIACWSVDHSSTSSPTTSMRAACSRGS